MTTSRTMRWVLLAAALVAVTVTVWGVGMDDGAVYRPAVEMLPIGGLIPQVTAVFAVFVTVAVNCCACLCVSVAIVGLTETVTGGTTDRVVVPDLLASAMLVAVTALFVALGGVGYAAVTVPFNSVGTNQLQHSSVTHSKLRFNAVSYQDIQPQAIGLRRADLNQLQQRVASTWRCSRAISRSRSSACAWIAGCAVSGQL